MSLKNLLFWLWCGLASAAVGQSYNFTNYSVIDGLAQSQVTRIAQDRRGDLWLATQGGGVDRFDGLEFYNLRKQDSLPSNFVLDVAEDHAGQLWFATSNGLVAYDGRRFGPIFFQDTTVTRLLEDTAHQLWVGTTEGLFVLDSARQTVRAVHTAATDEKAPVRSLLLDAQGQVLVNFPQEGLFRYWEGQLKPVVLSNAERGYIQAVLLDRTQKLWLGTTTGIYVQQPNASFQQEHFFPTHEIEEDTAGNIWFATSRGVFRQRAHAFVRIDDPLNGAYVEDIFCDREGNVWLASSGAGIYKFMGDRFAFVDHTNGLPHDVVMTVNKDTDGAYWFGTSAGGVSRLQDGEIEHFSMADGLGSNAINCSVLDSLGQIWFGTRGGGVSRFDAATGRFITYAADDGLAYRVVYCGLLDADRKLWFGTHNGLSVFENGTFTSFGAGEITGIRSLCRWENDALLVQSEQGFFVFRDGTFTRHPLSEQMPHTDILSIIQGPAGDFWFAHYGDGVFRYDPASGRLQQYTEAQGLTSGLIFSLVFDYQGNLWTGTERGLDRLRFNPDHQLQQVTHYGVAEGFLGVEANEKAVYLDDDSTLWFGTIRGVYCYHPGYDIQNGTPPVTTLTDLLLFYQPTDLSPWSDTLAGWYPFPRGLSLPYHQNHLTFRFRATSLADPKGVRYRFMLAGFDSDWSPAHAQQEAVYANLAPGDYTFLVEAANADGVWNRTPQRFSFQVRPPFWHTVWFYLLMAAATFLLLWLVYRYSIRRKLQEVLALEQAKTEAVERVRKELARDFHDELGNKLAGITVLSSLLRVKLNGSARGETDHLLGQIEDYSTSLFKGTKEFVWALDPKSDHFEEMITYLKDFGEQFFAHTPVTFVVKDDLLNEASAVVLPPGWSRQIILIFKEAMTNCLKHAQAQHVWLDAAITDGTLRIRLTDDGVGMAQPAGFQGNGLKNMQHRAKGIHCRVSIAPPTGSGTRVTFSGHIPQKR
ncbi:Two component regulator propeller [Catalinimonas alkaloidigena]|uniref:histidine kinase n=1 Tax=Catalinimonas alkaloidigena TaxID=1075417 RepID=A0A1G9QNJ6_9BACT|nr:sensor histidine kinase [Catalinimonas alkaloidigena]SDM12584.1 Two component regulator propeller [Catalinimonas alkaloidigena]